MTRASVRGVRPVDWVVLGPASAAILVGLVLTVPWATHGPVLDHLWITVRYLGQGAWVVLMYNLQVTTTDLRHERGRKRRDRQRRGDTAGPRTSGWRHTSSPATGTTTDRGHGERGQPGQTRHTDVILVRLPLPGVSRGPHGRPPAPGRATPARP